MPALSSNVNSKVAVATTSQGAADAAAEISELGGNAVDCAIAAAMYSINTEPGVCALAGSAYVTIWAPGAEPITIDGNVAIPGIGLPAEAVPEVESLHMDYGGGIETIIGAASIAVPGTPAALNLASLDYGQLPWRELLSPTIRATKTGFPLSEACHYYLEYSGKPIFARNDDSYTALHDTNGELKNVHDNIVVPNLSDSLAALAEEGSRIFYEGEIGQRIAEHVQDRGGLLTIADLKQYKAIVREALCVEISGWKIATNPPPAVGGAVLSAMLLAFGNEPVAQWNAQSLRQLMRVQDSALSYRKQELDLSDNVPREAAELLRQARCGELISKWSSASTVHTSAVDNTGVGCAITASSGYGSGEMPLRSGLWLNNCLGELELNRRGLAAGPPGKRLPSNMAPSVARTSDGVLAIGSPGADRITTALHQFLINFLQIGHNLADAVAHPRLHLDITPPASIAVEPGLDLPDTGISVTKHAAIGMYFGGVAAALYDKRSGFEVAADPRREGGTFLSNVC